MDGPENYETRGTYKGPIPMLKGETAKVVVYPGSPRVLAQFENVETGYSTGFHDFDPTHFDLEPRTDG